MDLALNLISSSNTDENTNTVQTNSVNGSDALVKQTLRHRGGKFQQRKEKLGRRGRKPHHKQEQQVMRATAGVARCTIAAAGSVDTDNRTEAPTLEVIAEETGIHALQVEKQQDHAAVTLELMRNNKVDNTHNNADALVSDNKGITSSVNDVVNDLEKNNKTGKNIVVLNDAPVVAVVSEAAVSQVQTSVLQALGLTRGLSMGVGFGNTTINLSKNMSVITSEPPSSKLSLASPATTLAKTVPLLVNMKGTAGAGTSTAVSSLLPANLPPGRYVIISSPSAPPTPNAPPPAATLTATNTTTTINSSYSPTVQTTLFSTPSTTTTTVVTNTSPAAVPAVSPSTATPASTGSFKSHRFSSNRGVGSRAPVGRTRGMRKSYTTSEKLAMIEAVESGLKKSVVADQFGVAPSTLACIILQKDKIRREQSKSSLSRRRLRPSSCTSSHASQGAAAESRSGHPTAGGGDHEYHGNGRASMGGFQSLVPGVDSKAPLLFTHFLANFDQSMTFDNVPAEEIVSVPDFTETLSYVSNHSDAANTTHCVRRYSAGGDVAGHEQDGGAGLAAVGPEDTTPAAGNGEEEEVPEESHRVMDITAAGERDEDHDLPAVFTTTLESTSCRSPPIKSYSSSHTGSIKLRNPSHAAKNVSALDRVHEFGDVLMTDESGLRLLCWACGFVLDHTRRSTIVEHLRSRKHNRCCVFAQALKTSVFSNSDCAAPKMEPHDLACEDPDHTPEEMDIIANILRGGGPELTNSDGHDEDDDIHENTIEPETSEVCTDNCQSHNTDAAGGRTSKSSACASNNSSTSSAMLSGMCLIKREVHCYSVLDQLMRDQTYTDVTLTTDGHTFHAHKVVLCVASSYFRRVLCDNSPGVRSVVVLRDIPHTEMRSILQFLYTGEATVDASELPSFMRTAQMLEIASLCESGMGQFPPAAAPPTTVSDTPASGTRSQTATAHALAVNEELLPARQPKLTQVCKPKAASTPIIQQKHSLHLQPNMQPYVTDKHVTCNGDGTQRKSREAEPLQVINKDLSIQLSNNKNMYKNRVGITPHESPSTIKLSQDDGFRLPVSPAMSLTSEVVLLKPSEFLTNNAIGSPAQEKQFSEPSGKKSLIRVRSEEVLMANTPLLQSINPLAVASSISQDKSPNNNDALVHDKIHCIVNDYVTTPELSDILMTDSVSTENLSETCSGSNKRVLDSAYDGDLPRERCSINPLTPIQESAVFTESFTEDAVLSPTDPCLQAKPDNEQECCDDAAAELHLHNKQPCPFVHRDFPTKRQKIE